MFVSQQAEGSNVLAGRAASLGEGGISHCILSLLVGNRGRRGRGREERADSSRETQSLDQSGLQYLETAQQLQVQPKEEPVHCVQLQHESQPHGGLQSQEEQKVTISQSCAHILFLFLFPVRCRSS